MKSRVAFYECLGVRHGFSLEWDPSETVILVAWCNEEARTLKSDEGLIAWEQIWTLAGKLAYFDREEGKYYDLKRDEAGNVPLSYFDPG